MNILLVEDTQQKLDDIREVIVGGASGSEFVIRTADSVNAALRALGEQRFDLVVVDLVLPQLSGSPETQDTTAQWCEHIENSSSTKLSSWMALTSYSELATEAWRSFARHGVAVVEFDAGGGWRRVVRSKVKELFVNRPLDFVVICALEKEKRGFRHCPEVVLGEAFTSGGLDCQSVLMSDLRGVIVVLSRPGLISSAIETVKATESFRPKAVAMSGICGGVSGESKLGDLVVPEVSWNYQAGKIKDGVFKPELVQTPLPPKTRAKLRQLANDAVSRELREGLFHSELGQAVIISSPMVSGSQVVADAELVAEIESQSRKIGALDMEVASVFSAAYNFFNGGGVFFAAKTVVDLADVAKDDRYHEYGCVLSARFVVKALRSLLPESEGSAPFSGR